MDNSEALKTINELRGSMDKLLTITDKIVNDIPAEYRGEMVQIKKDISQVQNAVKNGDLTALNELTKRYADINTKH